VIFLASLGINSQRFDFDEETANTTVFSRQGCFVNWIVKNGRFGITFDISACDVLRPKHSRSTSIQAGGLARVSIFSAFISDICKNVASIVVIPVYEAINP